MSISDCCYENTEYRTVGSRRRFDFVFFEMNDLDRIFIRSDFDRQRSWQVEVLKKETMH